MILHKKDLKKGAILPIYTDYKAQKGFVGMARLIEEVESKIHDKNASGFIKSEAPQIKKEKHHKGSLMAIREENDWVIKEISKASTEKIVFTDGTFIDAPFKGKDMLTGQYTYLLECDNYVKSWSVIDDRIGSTVFAPNSEILLNKEKPKGVVTLHKPYNYEIEPFDSVVKIFKSERWKVEHLERAFQSNIRKGKKMYYRDWGIVEIAGKHKSKVYFYHPEKREVVSGIAGDFFIIGDKMRIGHAWISFHCKNARNIEDRELVNSKEIHDFWEESEDN